MNVRLIAILLLIVTSLAVALAITVPADFGKYGPTFDWEGVIGFVQMQSVIVVQVWLAAANAVLLPLGLREARRRNLTAAGHAFSIATVCAILGFACSL